MEDLSDLVKGLDIKSRQLALRHKKLKDEFDQLQIKQLETENNITQQKANQFLNWKNKYK